MGDTCNSDILEPLAVDADILVHEATNAWIRDQVMTHFMSCFLGGLFDFTGALMLFTFMCRTYSTVEYMNCNITLCCQVTYK
jgi:hypothetical protein